MFSFFHNTNIDFSSIGIDMHSHLLPGIDDGAKTIDKSIEYIKDLVQLGFKEIITTPHIMGDYYKNNPSIIQAKLKEVQHELKKHNVHIPINAAAEYYVDDYFIDLCQSNEPLLTFSENKILIEFSTFAPPIDPFELIFMLQTKGLNPILAHPERYLYYKDKFDVFQNLKQKGCALQVNIMSLVGHYGAHQKKLAQKILKNNLADFAGTDVHNSGHLKELRKALKNRYIRNVIAKYPFQNNTL